MTTCTCSPAPTPGHCESIHTKHGIINVNIGCGPFCCEPENPVDPVPPIACDCQQILKADRDLYVSPDGSDDNNGLTPEAAFKTITAAVESTRKYTRTGYLITIHVASGTYTEDISIDFRAHYTNVKILGAAPGMPVLVGDISAQFYGTVSIENIHSKSEFRNFLVHWYSYMALTNCRATTLGSGHSAVLGAYCHGELILQGTLDVDCSAGTEAIFRGGRSGVMYPFPDAVITINGVVTVGVVHMHTHASILLAGGTIVQGAVTGKRYSGNSCAVIGVTGGSATFIPGTIAGAVTNGAVYIAA